MLQKLIPEDADWLIPEPVEMKRPLGSGAFATAHEASWKGSQVAAKKLHDIFFNPAVVPEQQRMTMLTEFVRECTMQAKMRHPNIVQLYGVYIPDGDGRKPPVMLCELMAETLRARNQREPRLTFHDVIDLALQIACGLRFLHERDQPIGHRDLSANNVLLTGAGVCKIGDVGLAKVFTPAARITTTMKPGAEPYMPSEVLAEGAEYDEKLDVFSLGVLLLEMLVGHEPRPSPQLTTRERIGDRVALFPIPETQRRRDELNKLETNNPMRPLIERLLQPQASRPAINEVYQELKRLESTDRYHHSPSTFSQVGGVNLSTGVAHFAGDLRSMAESISEISRQQAAVLQQVAAIQLRQQEDTASLQQQLQQSNAHQEATEQQLQTMMHRLQQAATQQELQAVTRHLQQTATSTQEQLQMVTQRLQQTATQQQLQEGLSQLEGTVQRSVEQRVSAVTPHVTDAIKNLSISGQASSSTTQLSSSSSKNQSAQARLDLTPTGTSSSLKSQPASVEDEEASSSTTQLSSSSSKYQPAQASLDLTPTRTSSSLKSQPAAVEDEEWSTRWRRWGLRCEVCRKELQVGEKYTHVTNIGHIHKECLKCTTCGCQLTKRTCHNKKGKLYCQPHY